MSAPSNDAATATSVISPASESSAAVAAHRNAEMHGLIHAVQSLLCIVIVAIFIITFAVQPFRIPSESMDPTLMVGDFLLVAKQNFPASRNGLPFPSTPVKRGDVIVFHYPVDPSLHLVKRVIGMPGDHLRLRDNHVFINGRALKEPYAVYRPGPGDTYRDNFPRLSDPDPAVQSSWWIQMKSLVNRGELTVPPHNFFVLGDNRNDSEDSRYWGFVPASAIVGKPLLIYFSVNEADRGDDDSEAPEVSAMSTVKPQKRTMLGEIVGFARWDRTLRVVR